MTLPFENPEYNTKFTLDQAKKWALGKISLNMMPLKVDGTLHLNESASQNESS